MFRIGGFCFLFFSGCSLHLLTLGFCVMLFHLQVINYDSSRGGVSVITEKGDVTTSFLLIQNADLADSGKYSCAPSNADVASVRVHVLNGKYLVTSLHTDSHTHEYTKTPVDNTCMNTRTSTRTNVCTCSETLALCALCVKSVACY